MDWNVHTHQEPLRGCGWRSDYSSFDFFLAVSLRRLTVSPRRYLTSALSPSTPSDEHMDELGMNTNTSTWSKMGITLPIPFVNEYYPYPTRLKWIHRILPIPYPFHVGTGSRIGFEYPATSRMVMPKDTIVPWSWAVSFFIYKRLSWFYRKHISEFFYNKHIY
jgi:hypothetical protein